MPNEEIQVLLFQIVRELLFNVVKHAGAKRATVEVGTQVVAGEIESSDAAERCIIRVSDEGKGFDPVQMATADKQGFGLFSVHERLKLFGGSMEIVSAPGWGTLITLNAPLATRVKR